MLVAWLLVALIERASSREQAKALAGPSKEAQPAQMEEPVVVAATGRSWLFGRRRREAPEVMPSPAAALEERVHVTRLEPEVAEIEVEATEVIVDVPTPRPTVTKRPLELPGLEEPEPEPMPVLVAEAPPPPPAPPRAGAGSRGALVPASPRAAADASGVEPLGPRAASPGAAGERARDEEWSALFMHLRGFANADGVLPMEFDGLVRESFAELIQAACPVSGGCPARDRAGRDRAAGGRRRSRDRDARRGLLGASCPSGSASWYTARAAPMDVELEGGRPRAVSA